MQEITQDFVNTIMEANAMLPNLTGGDSNLGNGNKFEMPGGKGKGSGQDNENQGKGSAEVTGNQEAAKAASNAGPSNDTFSHEAKQEGGTSPAANTGLPANIGNKWSMPVNVHDSKDVTISLDDKVKSLTEAVGILVDIALNEDFSAWKATNGNERKAGENGMDYVGRYEKWRKANNVKPGKPARSLQGDNQDELDADPKLSQDVDTAVGDVKPASPSAAKKAAQAHGDED